MTTAGTTPFEEVLDAAGDSIRAAMVAVESELAAVASSYGETLGGPAGETLAAGGKRLRPLLVLVCGRAGSEQLLAPGESVRAGTAVELVHMATLVHDDVVDAAPERRGRPTVYATAGRARAAATGDFLFSRAFALLERSRDPEQVNALSSACLELARGELVQREDAFVGGIDVERYLLRCRLKTASLFTAACRLGALSAAGGSGPAARADTLGRFGARIGLAFQMLDDVLDVVGARERTGKKRGGDLLEGTTTLPLILARAEDPELAALDLRSLETRAQAEQVCDRIAATDAIAATRERARTLVSEAKSELDAALDERTSALLHLVADRVVDRYA